MTVSVLPNMLFRGLFIAFNLKIYLENPDWYIKLRMKLRNQESLIQNPLQDGLFIQLLYMPGYSEYSYLFRVYYRSILPAAGISIPLF